MNVESANGRFLSLGDNCIVDRESRIGTAIYIRSSGREFVSKEYHDIYLMKIPSNEEPERTLIVGERGACSYILIQNNAGEFEEVAGPYHDIEFYPESGMVQGGLGNSPGKIEVLDPHALLELALT